MLRSRPQPLEKLVQVRKAVIGDIPSIQKLVNTYARRGLMLPRSLHSLYDNIRDYSVVEENGETVGCVALHVCWEDLAELRSLAVSPERQSQGLGAELVALAIGEAISLGVRKVFVLTYVGGFFGHHGFQPIDKAELPHKIWQDCIHCVNFPDCDEEALIAELPTA